MRQLDRNRLRNNILDRQDAADSRIRRQGRTTATTNGQAQVYAAGMLLEVLDTAPEPPGDGYTLLYVEDDGVDVKVKAMNSTGDIVVLGTF